MAAPRTRKDVLAAEREGDQLVGFDVVVEKHIGFVELDKDGPHTAMEAAMLLIGGVAESGRYSFPSVYGTGMIEVEVNMPPTPLELARQRDEDAQPI